MAITLAHSSIADFPLFDDEQSFFSMSGDRQNGSFNHFVPSNDSNYSQSFIDMNMYQQQAQATAYDDTPSQYYHASHLVVNAPRIAVRHSAPQYTPSASPSTSLSHSGDQPSSILSTASNASMQSNTSSAVGSPYTQGAHVLTGQEQWAKSTSGLGFEHDFVQDEGYPTEIFPFSSSTESEPSVYSTDRNFGACVDPSLIHPSYESPIPSNMIPPHYQTQQPFPQSFTPPSPAPSVSSQDSYHTGPQRHHHNYPPTRSFNPYPPTADQRRMSHTPSRYTADSPRSVSLGYSDESKERVRCPNPDCGKPFKDLKAHMLTHQAERPEKCPIVKCEYHIKGFARKYDKQRHTLTHYKGTMVCGFCPGSGSPAEKSFNRADVFKRHLTSVHQVEQSPPNARKKSPSFGTAKKATNFSNDVTVTGKCSTCSHVFKNAQEFYEHLDDCVLSVVQQEEPSEAINEKALTAISRDPAVQETLERNNLPNTFDYQMPSEAPLEDDDNDEDEDEEDAHHDRDAPWSGLMGAGSMNPRSGRGAIKTQKRDPSLQSTHPRGVVSHAGGGTSSVTKAVSRGRQGLTHSRGGVPLAMGKGRKKRKHYPTSWGYPAERMKMKKRVVCSFDGGRRLWKDELMLDNDCEVRLPLPEAGMDAYVTELDIATVTRAEAFHDMSDEDKGPWVKEDMENLII